MEFRVVPVGRGDRPARRPRGAATPGRLASREAAASKQWRRRAEAPDRGCGRAVPPRRLASREAVATRPASRGAAARGRRIEAVKAGDRAT